MSFIKELKRRNVIRVAIAYSVATWFLIEVSATTFPMLRLPEWTATFVTVLLLIGFPVALIFAWAFELTPEGIKKEKDVDRSESITHVTGRKLDFAIIAVLAAALVFFVSTHQWSSENAVDPDTAEAAAGNEHSIAVLPFVNMSDDPGNEYFSDGISEELLNVLVRVEGLRVASRTSSFAFKDKDASIPSIGKELNVNHVLEGSVRKAGNTVRVTAQLVDVRTDSHLWSETYDRQLEDIFAIQDEISGQIVQALKIALGAGEQPAMTPAEKPTENLEAYERYLQGRYFWQRRGEDNIRHAIDLFEQATELDPMFARAWSSLAAAHITLPSYSVAPADVHYSQAASVAQRALALDDSLAEAYAVLGDVARSAKKWAEAKQYYLLATASEPKNATAHLWYAEHLQAVGRKSDALEEILIAYQLDPLHPGTNHNLAWTYWGLDDTSNQLKYGAAAWDLGHPEGLHALTWARLRLGEFDRAIKAAEQYDDVKDFPVSITKLFVEARLDPVKRPLFLETLAKHEAVVPFSISLSGYVRFGRMDDAFRLVHTNLDILGQSAWWTFWQPEMALFRADPRFAGLVTEAGLLDYWREHGWPDDCQPAGNSVSCE
jgi:TolB-like protein/Tfp pilus assembly protein PilF